MIMKEAITLLFLKFLLCYLPFDYLKAVIPAANNIMLEDVP